MKKGDTIGLIAPSSGVGFENVEPCANAMRELGFDVVVGESCYAQHGYLSGTDSVRARDINKMFKNKRIDGVFCIRGGYGAQRLLRLIDFENIKENPKFFCGYSDITALHIAINQRCGLVTYHTPMPLKISLGLDDYTMDFYKRCLFDGLAGELKNPEGQPLKRLVGGKCEGVLTGGNLSLIATSIGTEHEIDTRGKIIFIEEVDEEPYKIDRMLLQMKLAGKFRDCRGIIFGAFTNCVSRSYEDSLSLAQIFKELIVPEGKPAVCGLACGHCLPTMSLPMGGKIELNSDKLLINAL